MLSSTLRALAVLLLGGLLLYGCGGDDGGNSDPSPGAGGTGRAAIGNPVPAATSDNLFLDVVQDLLDRAQQPLPVYSLSGTVHAAAGNAVDGDVNDPVAPYSPNDAPATAQPIPNPVSLGGYANRPGTGPRGRSQLSGDTFDSYRVTLTAGQTIDLFIAEDGFANDLDLSLYDTNVTLIDASIGTGRFESLTVPRSGEYLILVEAFQGASSYVLVVGQSQTPRAGPASGQPMRLSDAFMPGEAVVRFQERSTAASQDHQARAQALGMTVKGGDEGRNLLLELEETAGTRSALGLAAPDDPWHRFPDSADELYRKWETLRAIKTLQQRPDVLYASPNYLRYPALVPSDNLYPRQWHYPLINLPRAWDVNTGSGAIVAVLDTGVLLSHPDLQGQLLEGYDFISDPRNAGDGDGLDADPGDPGDQSGPGGRGSFHGTHVTGTAAAATNNTIGVAGVAFSARIMPLRVLGIQGGTDFDIEQALRYAAGLPNDSGRTPPRRADVVNLSLGGGGFSAASQALYRQIHDSGVVIVAAAGNDANAVPFYPAAYDGVIAVSAVDINRALAPYSNFGSFVDVAAPGGNTQRDVDGDGNPDGVLSTGVTEIDGNLNADYILLQGTSMATPHMAGVVALMRSANPTLTPQDIDNLLASGALTDDLGTPGRDDRFGHGLINAYKAVVTASNTPGGNPVTPVPILAVNPASLNFGITLTRLALTVTNGGGGELRVNPPTQDSSGWLSITAQVDNRGLGTYTVTVDREGLADGVYTATITFTSNANPVSVPVIMQVANNLPPGEIGQHYVILFDPAAQVSVDSVPAVRQANGDYTYRFENIPAGVYEIFAGTDLNNNFVICDPGEACGAYLALDDPIDVLLDRNIENLDFGSSFSASLEDNQGASEGSPARVGIPRSGPVPKRVEP